MILRLIGISVLIAFCAAVAAWAYVMAYVLIHSLVSGTSSASPNAALVVAIVSLMGSYVVGLPVAILLYILSSDQIFRSPAIIVMTSMLAGVVMIIASFVIGGEAGITLLGIPAFIAAMTYAFFGWHWILKPQRAQRA